MHCKYCNSDNSQGAKFCRSCGKELEPEAVNTLDRYPEYNLAPSSVRKPQSYFAYRFYLWLASFFLIAGLYFGLGLTILGLSSSKKDPFLFGSLILFVSIFLAYIVVKMRKKAKRHDISKICDCFQQSATRRYIMILKDGKFGVYDKKNGAVTVPCSYQYLAWKSYPEYMAATQGVNTLYIDIHNNHLKIENS